MPFSVMQDCLAHDLFEKMSTKKRDNPEMRWMQAQEEQKRIYRVRRWCGVIETVENDMVIFQRCEQGEKDTIHCFVTPETFQIVCKYWTRSVINYFSLDSTVKTGIYYDELSPFKVYRTSDLPKNKSVSESLYNQLNNGIGVCEEFNRLYTFDFKPLNLFQQRVLALFFFHTGDLNVQFVDIRDLPDEMRLPETPARMQTERTSKRSRPNSNRSASKGRGRHATSSGSLQTEKKTKRSRPHSNRSASRGRGHRRDKWQKDSESDSSASSRVERSRRR